MAFAFKRKETVLGGVNRLAIARIKSAIKGLKDYRHPEAIHEVRKDIKKVRAVLRLARECIPQKVYRRQTHVLRKAADQLAPVRDAYVRGAALKTLDHQGQSQLSRRASREISQRFADDLTRAEKQFGRKKRARKVRRLLKQIPPALDDLKYKSKGWRAIAPGVQTAFARARQAYLQAQEQPSPEQLHHWRKRVKDLWYQANILRPIYPERLDAMAAELKTLSEYLGDAHDLFMLQKSLGTHPESQLERGAPAILKGIIQKRRHELQSAALKMGKRIYAEQPSAFSHRLAGYWKAWRKDKESTKSPDN